MIVKDEYYERIDMPVYREVVAPVLSGKILDAHAHSWPSVPSGNQLSQYPEFNDNPYLIEHLLTAGSLMFPEQEYHAIVFGNPQPLTALASNRYVAEQARSHPGLYPLCIPDMRATEEQVRQMVRAGGFYGFKPYWGMVDWKTREDDVTVLDMLPEPYMRVAEDWGLIIMLHIPGSKRLASETNTRDIQHLSRQYPHAKIVIAHLGRSYCLWSMQSGIEQICLLPNVYFDTSFVQEAMVYKVLFDRVDPARVMYGTDLPISEVHGRRVCINGGWVDVSRDRLSWTAARDEQHPIPATFMTYEMIRALREGAEAAGLTTDELRPVFYENGMRLIENVQATLTGEWRL